MKRFVFVCFMLFCSQDLFAQTQLTENEKLASLCKVWGFLKYYHPVVAKGKHDWDKELVDHFEPVLAAKDKEALSKVYLKWIASLGRVKLCNKCSTSVPDSLKFNLDLSWLNDKNTFTDSLVKKLHFIEQNRNQGKNYYVQQNQFVGNTVYKNEKPYTDMVYPSYEYRMLSLYRYWNIINYYFPYKYVIGEDWNKVLEEMIPKFRYAKDTMAYHLAMLELVVKINDSHAGFTTRYTNQYFGFKWVPFTFKVIDNKAIVTGFYNDSMAKRDDIRYGDVILKVGGRDVKEIMDEKFRYVNGSNTARKISRLYYVLFNGQSDSVNITYERGGTITNKYVHRYLYRTFNYKRTEDTEAYKMLDSNIGYVNMGVLKPEQVDEAMKTLWSTQAIVFDVRNYPDGTMYRIAGYINSEAKLFAMFSEPEMNYPGIFSYKKPYTCGKKNKDPYKGKVVILFNESTQSHAEFTCMALQTAPNAISIGSQTSGADGNISIITLPGGYTTYMTGIGVYYPDGRETQRIGIVPDIEVKPTIEGIRNKRDEVLDRAITYILTGK